MNRGVVLTLPIPLSQPNFHDPPFKVDPSKARIACSDSGASNGGESDKDFENSGCSEFGVW